MSKLRRIFLIVVIAAVSLSAASVIRTRHAYYGVCSQLDGFAGLLQKADLLQAGSCKGLPGGIVCNAGGGCKVNGKEGTCANTAVRGSAPVCVCVATISRP
jgi:hypothetical protein